jgi:hypothetical protein
MPGRWQEGKCLFPSRHDVDEPKTPLHALHFNFSFLPQASFQLGMYVWTLIFELSYIISYTLMDITSPTFY